MKVLHFLILLKYSIINFLSQQESNGNPTVNVTQNVGSFTQLKMFHPYATNYSYVLWEGWKNQIADAEFTKYSFKSFRLTNALTKCNYMPRK